MILNTTLYGLPEFFRNDDGIEPRLNICAAILPDHSGLWILDRNSKQIGTRFGFVSAFVEVTTQYVGGSNLLVLQNQRLHHFYRSIMTNAVRRKVFMIQYSAPTTILCQADAFRFCQERGAGLESRVNWR